MGRKAGRGADGKHGVPYPFILQPAEAACSRSWYPKKAHDPRLQLGNAPSHRAGEALGPMALVSAAVIV